MAKLLQVSMFVTLIALSRGALQYITSASNDVIDSNNTCFFEGRQLQPCSTLETLAPNTALIGQNSTFYFLPGNYVVNIPTHLNFTTFQLIILKPLVDNGNVIEIKCEAKMIITFWDVKIVIIKNLEFYSCSGIGYVR